MNVYAINGAYGSNNVYRPLNASQRTLNADNPNLINILNPASSDDADNLFNIINGTQAEDNYNKPWWDVSKTDSTFKALFSYALSVQQEEPKEETFFDPGYISVWLQHPNTRLSALAIDITKGLHNNDDKATAIIRWVIANFPYEFDEVNYGVEELWAPPTFALQTGSGDCIANYEEIQTASGLKRVGDLEVGDVVLSYDFVGKRFCTLPITKIWEKGELPVYRVTFKNGSWVDVTEDHPFWTRRTQQYSDYEKTKLCDIDMNNWWERRVPCMKQTQDEEGFGFDGLTETSIESVEYLGEYDTRDFEIPLTHTFINKFGILLHNCEDGAFLVHSLLLHAGVPYNRIRTYGGLVKAGIGAEMGGHGWTTYKRESDDEWVVLDTSYYPNTKHVTDRRLMKYDSRYVDNFFWFNKLNWTVTYDIDRIHNPEAPIYNAKGYMDKKVKLAGWLINELA